MSRLPKGVGLLDACVLYPASIRDLLLHLADLSLYMPKWTVTIQQEWTRNLLRNRPDINAEALTRTVDAMNAAFPDANVDGYEALIDTLSLPDADDRHVLAAAIRCKATVIVTANLKDFPVDQLSPCHLTAQHPDQFISDLIERYSAEGLRAFQNQVAMLRKPPKTSEEVLATLTEAGLPMTAQRLRELSNRF